MYLSDPAKMGEAIHRKPALYSAIERRKRVALVKLEAKVAAAAAEELWGH